MDHGVGFAILVDQLGDRVLDPALLYRETGRERESSAVVQISALGFFRRLITRVTELITRIRRFFVFRLADGGRLQGKKGRGGRGNEVIVEESASRICEPHLAEILVSQKETTTDSEAKTVERLDQEEFDISCTRQVIVEHEQTPAHSATCEPSVTVSSEEDLHGIRNSLLPTEAPSGACDSKLESPVEESAVAQVATSKSGSEKFSIHQLNAMVAERLIKYLQTLESCMIPTATSTQKRKHWRAILLATLVAVAVWARNSKHLHESMPCIKGSSINVHIRSRL